ncbi:MAG: SRPBCC family protein [Flavobacteriales bacterium]|nr:SRPBCC family protein [Flavobacteriales bacterium]
MKILKTILLVLLVLVVLAVIAMLILPKNVSLSRSIEIDASPELAWKHVNSMRSQNEWSPWNELDTTMVQTFEGEDGAVGSSWSWKGNDKVGTGKQTIRAIDSEKMLIENDLEFFEPWEAKCDVSVQVEALEGGRSKVTWNFNQPAPMPGNLFMTLMGMKGALTKDFDKGLGMLKKLVEEDAATPDVATFEVRREERGSMEYMIKKETVGMADMKAYFERSMPAVYQTAKDANILDTTAAPVALYFTWDEESQKSELSAAVRVIPGSKPATGYEVHKTSAGPCLIVDYYGPYEKTGDAHMFLDGYMKENNLELSGAVMEEYITDPSTEPDPAKWLTRIVYPVKEAAAAESVE